MYESKSGGPESEIKTAVFAIRIKHPFLPPNAGGYRQAERGSEQLPLV